MITKIEVASDGTTQLRVFHSYGSIGQHKTGKYKWTHAPDPETRAACTACTSGKLPADIRKS